MSEQGIRLNLGCGKKESPGWTRLDISPEVGADIVCDIREGIALPDDSVIEVQAHHILEHFHDVESVFLELYRVCRDGALLDVRVPHYLSHHAYDTLDHVHFFTPGTFVNLDRSRHPVTAFTKFFRFACESWEYGWDEDYIAKHRDFLSMPDEHKERVAQHVPNVAKEIHAVLRCLKP